MSSDDKYVDQTRWVGGGGGIPFTLSQVANGKMPTQLRFWKTGDTICGVRMTYNTGDSEFQGSMANDSDMINLAPGELITKFSMWDNGKRSSRMTLGRVLIETKGQSFNFGVDGGTVEYRRDVYSGLLAGMFGANGTEIDRFGLIFLKRVRRVQINISNDGGWPSGLAGSSQGINQVTLAERYYDNPQNGTTPWQFVDSETEEVSTEYSQTATKQWGLTSEVSAGFLDIGVKVSASWTQSTETTSSSTTTDTTELSWGITGTMDPTNKQKRIKATAFAYKGVLDIDYTSKVVVTMESGDTFSYSENGQFKNVEYSSGEAGWEVISYWD